MRAKLIIASCLGMFLVMAGSCTTAVSMKIPTGFADYPSSGPRLLISPEGIKIEAYTQPNVPQQSADFWVQAYLYHMAESGYTSLGELESFDGMLGPMFLAQWVVPYRGEQYLYAHALAVNGDLIYIAEIAGPLELYQEYRSEIISSLKSLH